MKKISLLFILLYFSQNFFAQNSNYGLYVLSGIIVKIGLVQHFQNVILHYSPNFDGQNNQPEQKPSIRILITPKQQFLYLPDI